MKRRIFLAMPVCATALLSEAKPMPDDKPVKGFKVEKNKGRRVEQLKVLGSTFDCKVSAKDTNGQLCIFDTLREGQTSPPLHFHYEQDEWFYAVKGEFKVQIGDEVHLLKEGDSAFAPRRVPHTFAKTSEGVGQMMIVFQPAGTMEEFFIERVALEYETDAKKKEEALKTLWNRHGMKLVDGSKKI